MLTKKKENKASTIHDNNYNNIIAKTIDPLNSLIHMAHTNKRIATNC